MPLSLLGWARIAGCVATQSVDAVGCVLGAGGVGEQRAKALGSVETAGAVVKERLKTKVCAVDPGSQAKEGVCSLSRVVPGIASIWRRTDCLCPPCKSKDPKRKCD